jgi:hypothetical protein
VQFSNGVSANTHKEFAYEILMTMAHIPDEGVLSLSFQREPTSGEEGRHRQKGNRDQRCYV